MGVFGLQSSTGGVLLAGWLVVLGSGCDERGAVPEPAGELAVEPAEEEAAPKPVVALPETYAQLDLFYALQERILELEIEIAQHNAYQREIRFEDFLDLDPWTLDAEQLHYLKHFCENGDFTLSKEAEILLLTRELMRRRNAVGMGPGVAPGGVLDRLDRTLLRFEQRIADLERVAALYRDTADEQIAYVIDGGPDALGRLRQDVAGRQAAIRRERALLEDEIAELHGALDELGPAR